MEIGDATGQIEKKNTTNDKQKSFQLAFIYPEGVLTTTKNALNYFWLMHAIIHFDITNTHIPIACVVCSFFLTRFYQFVFRPLASNMFRAKRVDASLQFS